MPILRRIVILTNIRLRQLTNRIFLIDHINEDGGESTGGPHLEPSRLFCHCGEVQWKNYDGTPF